LIRLTRANGLLFTSRVVLAEEALTMGLVNAVVAPAELLPYTYNYCTHADHECIPRITTKDQEADLFGPASRCPLRYGWCCSTIGVHGNRTRFCWRRVRLFAETTVTLGQEEV